MMAEDVLQVNHLHVVFTIEEGLRQIFQRHRQLLKPLMDEAVGIIQDWFKKKFKKKFKIIPGIIAGLHTFGAQMNFNPHVSPVSKQRKPNKKKKSKNQRSMKFEKSSVNYICLQCYEREEIRFEVVRN